MKNYFLPLFLLSFIPFIAYSQTSISGKVFDSDGVPLIGANVRITKTTKGAVTNLAGEYKFMLDTGNFTIAASYIGYSSQKNQVQVTDKPLVLDFILSEDQLGLDELIVTGVFNQKSKLESSVAITTIRPDMIRQRLPRGTGDLLNAVPGTYVDNSGGEVGNRVYARGMASGTSDNTGFRYVSLQEDGLPIMSSLVQFATADMFSRVDVNVGRFEAIRGGSSVITAPNAPGGVYNFISQEGRDKFGGTAIMKAGINGRDNLYSRFDLGLGGPISDTGLNYYVGGFYRFDEGARDIPFDANVGGQIKGNLTKTHSTGKIKLYGKYLDDRVTQYRPLPFSDLENLTTYSNELGTFDPNYSSTFPSLNTQIPDFSYGKADGATRDFNSDEGIDILTKSIGLEITQDLGEWTIVNNAKYTKVNQRYLQYVANVVAPYDTAMASLGYTAAQGFVPAAFSYYDAETNELLRSQIQGVDKIGDNLFATFTLDMNNEISDFMNQSTISRTLGNHSISFGGFFSSSTLKSTWHGDLLLGAFEPNFRPLRVTHPGPGGTTLQVSDSSGVAGYNFITLLGFEGNSKTYSAFVNDVWQASPKLSLDFGIRTDIYVQEGFKRGWESGNQDGNPLTLYDVISRKHNESIFSYNETYNTLSFSVGANYLIDDSKAVFARISKGNKAPDHEWYISNFENNTPIGKGTVEKIYQAEVGYKVKKSKYSIFATAFYSLLDDITYQNFVTGSNTTFFTPPTFNKSRTIGLELEATASPVKNLDFRLVATLQDAEFIEFDLYDLNGTTPRINSTDGSTINPLLPDSNSDDFLVNLDGKKVNEIPSVITDLTTSYRIKNFLFFVNWRYTGKYWYNKRNIFKMPDYSTFNGGLSYNFTSKLNLAVNVNNLFNAVGATRTEGLAKIDGNKEFFTKEDFEQHKNNAYGTGLQGTFWATPILPRMITASVTYDF
ncbi:MAG: iron complex outermembrane receptor protein [Arenicella sp.]|jgi:iron complex outermembrane receptor protein